ncbi:hypothetical protein M408DRAFT_318065 [Serendipita vermifera MAFF 305830]|uniref:Uncharacterized protein n=1 Tax=Serendipita vermifera MAFF 305830 TaxID=933852 RepID=A0A0C2XS71_SERVB|nr:hypothetical protein M408DRAFT_318065 [Serendipita vermifera MAFF 305830]
MTTISRTNRIRVEAWSTQVYKETIINGGALINPFGPSLETFPEHLSNHGENRRPFQTRRTLSSNSLSSLDSEGALRSGKLHLEGSSDEESLPLPHIYPLNGIVLAPIRKTNEVSWQMGSQHTQTRSRSSREQLKRKRDDNDDLCSGSSGGGTGTSATGCTDDCLPRPSKKSTASYAKLPSQRKGSNTPFERQAQATSSSTSYGVHNPQLHGVTEILHGRQKVAWDTPEDAFIFGWQWIMRDRDMVESMGVGL